MFAARHEIMSDEVFLSFWPLAYETLSFGKVALENFKRDFRMISDLVFQSFPLRCYIVVIDLNRPVRSDFDSSGNFSGRLLHLSLSWVTGLRILFSCTVFNF